MSRTGQLHRILNDYPRSVWDMPRAKPPVDATDETEFPNIAEARRHAREKGLI